MLEQCYEVTDCVLRVEPDASSVETSRYGTVPALEATAIWHDDRSELVILAVNRHRTEPLDLEVELPRMRLTRCLDQWTLTGPDAAAKNTVDATERVSPRPLAGVTLEGGLLRAALPPLSWNVLRLDTT